MSAPPVSPQTIQQNAYPTIYNYDPAFLLNYRSARSKGTATVLTLGTSIIAGYGGPNSASTTTIDDTSIAAQLSQKLTARGLPARFQSLGTNHGYGGATTSKVSIGSGWINGQTALGGPVWGNLTTSNPLTFTPTAPFDTVNVYYCGSSGVAAFTADINGATSGSGFATVNVANGYGVTPFKQTISTSAVNAAGTPINIKRVSGTVNGIQLIEAYNSQALAPEVRMFNLGWGGTTVANWTQSVTVQGGPAPLISLVSGISPSLVLFDLNTNDWDAGTTLSTYITGKQTIISAIKSAGADCVMFVDPPSSPATTGDASYLVQQQYIQADYNLALQNNCVLVDGWRQFGGNWANANAAGLMFDNLHPNKFGYFDVIDPCVNLLLR